VATPERASATAQARLQVQAQKMIVSALLPKAIPTKRLQSPSLKLLVLAFKSLSSFSQKKIPLFANRRATLRRACGIGNVAAVRAFDPQELHNDDGFESSGKLLGPFTV
jgi:hypothetical protein